MPNVGDQHTANGAGQIINPFEEEKPHISEYTAQEIATLSSRLEKQLGPEYISSRQGPGGKPVYYLAAEKSITLANEVFGFNGWSSSIRSIQMDFVDVSGEKVSCGLHAIVRVTLRDGTYHEDVGYGHMENAKGKAQAFEKAKKEATTDALKRALRSFGNLLGNCVYDKDYLKRITKIKAPPSKWDVENLHRHSDFVSIKKEPDVQTGLQTENVAASRPHTHHEDEFGSDDFDEVDFAVPEGDDTEGGDQSGFAKDIQSRRKGSILAQHHPPPAPQTHREPPPPHKPNMHPVPTAHAAGGPNSYGSDRTTKPNTVLSRPRPTAAHPSSNLNNTTPKSHPPAQHQHQQAVPTPGEFASSSSSSLTHDPPVGFFTARAAETLRTNPSVQAPSFNPHLESPSIRKTAGIDHSKTRPVTRDAIVPPAIRPGVSASGPQGGMSVGSGGGSGFQPPGGRKVGMPGAGIASPMQNRGSYKPPQMVKRTATDEGGRAALGDVTNAGVINQSVDGADAKRMRINVHGSENVPGGVST